MKIELHEIPVRDVVAGYVDSAENGVVGYGGKLNIRPAFQREFIYKDKQRDEVIHTITKQFPLNVMYFTFPFNRQILPSPTDAPAADSTKPSLPENELLFCFCSMILLFPPNFVIRTKASVTQTRKVFNYTFFQETLDSDATSGCMIEIPQRKRGFYHDDRKGSQPTDRHKHTHAAIL
jgi:hypothetical protein